MSKIYIHNLNIETKQNVVYAVFQIDISTFYLILFGETPKTLEEFEGKRVYPTTDTKMIEFIDEFLEDFRIILKEYIQRLPFKDVEKNKQLIKVVRKACSFQNLKEYKKEVRTAYRIFR